MICSIFVDIRPWAVNKIMQIFSQEIKANPNNYDAWFDYIRLMENESTSDIVRETYERAIANIPPTQVQK